MDEGRERVAEGGSESNGKRGKKIGKGKEASNGRPRSHQPEQHLSEAMESSPYQGSHRIHAFPTRPRKCQADTV